MKDKIKYILNKKAFHIVVMSLIITALVFTAVFLIVKYDVEGETNMPFNISKIALISSSEGIDSGAGTNRWNFIVDQNNDIYIYIDKNEQYEKDEVIDSIKLENFKVEKTEDLGRNVIYKPYPLSTDKILFKNTEENEVEDLEFIGSTQSDVKNLQISNQGDLIYFRYANKEIAQYNSDEEEVNHSELLKKANITEDIINAKLSFDFIIKLKSGISYKTIIELDTPIDGLVENGTSSMEITDLSNIVFKRVNN